MKKEWDVCHAKMLFKKFSSTLFHYLKVKSNMLDTVSMHEINYA